MKLTCAEARELAVKKRTDRLILVPGAASLLEKISEGIMSAIQADQNSYQIIIDNPYKNSTTSNLIEVVESHLKAGGYKYQHGQVFPTDDMWITVSGW